MRLCTIADVAHHIADVYNALAHGDDIFALRAERGRFQPSLPTLRRIAKALGGGAVGLTAGVLMRATGVGLLVFGAIVLFIGLRISLRASRYEMAEHWFRFGLWATGTGIALQTIGVLVTIRAK